MAKTPAQTRATAKYDKANYDKVTLNLKKFDKINGDFLRWYAERKGISINGLMSLALKEMIERDKQKSGY